MTERLYYTDAYLRDFQATIVDVAEAGRRVYLDRTAFYPTSGGQPHDTGQLGGVDVTDVVDEGDRIAHLLADPGPLEIGSTVDGRIDWLRRFDHMQQHTGQHLLSGVFAESLNQETLSVHFGPAASTIDLATPALTPDQIVAAEERANALVTENRPVAVTFADAVAAGDLRKTPSRSGPLRIVTIDGVDRSACGGTHVRATGEIGPILLRKIERIRQATRLEFLCGRRAVQRVRAEHAVLAALSTRASAGTDELVAVFDKQRAELKQAEVARRDLEGKLNAYRARELYAEAAIAADGLRRIVVRDDGASLESLRTLGQAVVALPGAVFIGASGGGGTSGVVIAVSDQASFDAGAALKAALAAAGGRGGGTARLAQGTAGSAAALDQVIRYLLGDGDGAGTETGGASTSS